jgi:hypothetical protein
MAESFPPAAMPLLKGTNKLNSCAVSGATDCNELVGLDGAGGHSTSPIEPQSHSTSCVHAASWAIGVLDPYEDLGDSVSKSTDCGANASPNNPQKMGGQGDASSFHFQSHGTATRQLVHEQIHWRHPFLMWSGNASG